MKKNFFKIIGLITIIAFISLACGGGDSGGTPAQGNTLLKKLEWLKANAEDGETYDVEIFANEDVSPNANNNGQFFNLSYEGKNIVIRLFSNGGSNKTISLSESEGGTLFSVGLGVTLILDKNITLRGIYGNNSSIVIVEAGGSLIMREGSTITGNSNNSYGGGVYVDGGTFEMTGGTISGNEAEAFFSGGGVYVNLGIFKMNGGTISGNEAGTGGGVYVNSGTFEMTGGSISGNEASYGGGVYVNNGMPNGPNGGIFKMYGGTIYGSNEANVTLQNKAKNEAALCVEGYGGIAEYGDGFSIIRRNSTISGGTRDDGEPIPNAPTGVMVSANSSSSISVSWDTVSSATSYKVYYTISGGYPTLAATVSGTSFTHNGLMANTSYLYYIVAVNSEGEISNDSEAKWVTTQSSGGGEPSAPTGVTATAQSSSSISVSWSAVSGATSYKVYYATGSSSGAKVLADTVSVTSFTHNGLTANTTYWYFIVAVNSAGESGYSAAGSATTQSSSGGETAPSAPTGVTATANSSSSISVSWSAVSGATSYKVYYATGSSSGAKVLADTVSVTSYTHSGLTAETPYWYFIVAVNSAGESGYSVSDSATTQSSGGSGGDDDWDKLVSLTIYESDGITKVSETTYTYDTQGRPTGMIMIMETSGMEIKTEHKDYSYNGLEITYTSSMSMSGTPMGDTNCKDVYYDTKYSKLSSSISYKTDGVTVASKTDYTYDTQGRVTGITTYSDSGGGLELVSESTSYSYSALECTYTSTIYVGGTPTTTNVKITYDAQGRQIGMTQHSGGNLMSEYRYYSYSGKNCEYTADSYSGGVLQSTQIHKVVYY